jgi:hypothetical protein
MIYSFLAVAVDDALTQELDCFVGYLALSGSLLYIVQISNRVCSATTLL